MPETVKLFVLAGQSNMAGRAPASGLPTRLQTPPPRVQMDYVCSFGARSPKPEESEVVAPDPHRSKGRVALLPSPRHSTTPGEHFGPEIGFGHVLAAQWPEQRILIVKHGRGGTSLAEDWHPDGKGRVRLYRELLDQVQHAIRDFQITGAAAEIAAMVWCQGEADTTRRDWADEYENNLTALLFRVRRDLNAPQLPVILCLTGDGRSNPKMLFAPAVRRAQQNVAAKDPRTMLVSGDDLPLLDHVHFDATAQVKLGQRIAEAFLQSRTSLH
jgi:hypothetical protein